MARFEPNTLNYMVSKRVKLNSPGPELAVCNERTKFERRCDAVREMRAGFTDDAGDGGGSSKGAIPTSRTTDPNSHTPVGRRLERLRSNRHSSSNPVL